MARPKMNPNQPKINKEDIGELTEWDIDINKDKIPYVSHVPENPMKMTKSRKARIRKIIGMKQEGKTTKEIAEKLGIEEKQVKRDITTAMILTKENLPYLPAEDKALLRGVVTTYNDEARELFARVRIVVDELEARKTFLEPKAAMAYAMILGELRQTIELGAKLSGELTTGTRVNVVVFSSMIKRMIEIISEEVDRSTFIRIRDRMKLEMEGQQPLGDKGGNVEIITNGEPVSSTE
jgi:hypothetical protein